MTTRQRAAPGSQDLSTFQNTLRQQEQIFGKLTALSSQDGDNIMTFEIGQSPDDDHQIELATYEGSDPPEKSGKEVVCVGKCLVSNALCDVAAYRPTS